MTFKRIIVKILGINSRIFSMETKQMDVREALHNLAEQLPEEATWEDVFEHLRYRIAVAEGKEAAREGSFASDEDVKRVFAKYGVQA